MLLIFSCWSKLPTDPNAVSIYSSFLQCAVRWVSFVDANCSPKTAERHKCHCYWKGKGLELEQIKTLNLEFKEREDLLLNNLFSISFTPSSELMSFGYMNFVFLGKEKEIILHMLAHSISSSVLENSKCCTYTRRDEKMGDLRHGCMWGKWDCSWQQQAVGFLLGSTSSTRLKHSHTLFQSSFWSYYKFPSLSVVASVVGLDVTSGIFQDCPTCRRRRGNCFPGRS